MNLYLQLLTIGLCAAMRKFQFLLLVAKIGSPGPTLLRLSRLSPLDKSLSGSSLKVSCYLSTLTYIFICYMHQLLMHLPTLGNSPVQRVAVLHLEERCERAIEWALKIEPSIKYLVNIVIG